MRQNDLIKEIASKEGVEHSLHSSYDFSVHVNRGLYLDALLMSKEREKLSHELELLHQKYKKNQERLEGLYKQLFAEIF